MKHIIQGGTVPSEQGTFQITFGITIEVTADTKEIAVSRAVDVLRNGDWFDDEMDEDPITVVELDDNGDPII